MTKLKRGTRVIVTEPIRRGRGHRHGQAKVGRGARAQVVDRHSKRRYGRLVPLRRFETVTYDLDVDDGLRATFVPSVSESSLKRAPRFHLRRLLLVALLCLVVVQALGQRVG
jgi:hypothetical protein